MKNLFLMAVKELKLLDKRILARDLDLSAKFKIFRLVMLVLIIIPLINLTQLFKPVTLESFFCHKEIG